MQAHATPPNDAKRSDCGGNGGSCLSVQADARVLPPPDEGFGNPPSESPAFELVRALSIRPERPLDNHCSARKDRGRIRRPDSAAKGTCVGTTLAGNHSTFERMLLAHAGTDPNLQVVKNPPQDGIANPH
jgi:hypothetical protein